MNKPITSHKFPCYCCSEKDYQECCEPYHLGTLLPSTPEQLMRSRYSAFAIKNMVYIETTMKEKALHSADLEQTEEWLKEINWKRLSIIKSELPQASSGIVHFIAEYEENGEERRLEEISEFKKIANKWYYVHGRQLNPQQAQSQNKIGRNDPCPCASGKKYKHCCIS
ncbi:MAG: YchJ family protein [Candidatus Berkiella sp.]